jgi:outer membrane biosynthesis protein TonB
MDPQPQRSYVYRPTPKRWIAIMLVLSLLVHVGLIGFAAIWRVKVKPPQTEEEPPELIADFDAPEEDQNNTPEPTPEETPEPTPDEMPDVTPDMADEEPTPTPPPQQKPPAKPHLTPVPPGTKRGPVAQAGVPGGVGKPNAAFWSTPKPSYPFQARKLHLTGSGGVRVTTDASGRVVSAEMSPGINPILDQAAVSFARSSWKGPPNTTKTVPITFTLE